MATGQSSETDWRALLASAGPYPIEAFAFVRDGLSHTVEQVHRIDDHTGEPLEPPASADEPQGAGAEATPASGDPADHSGTMIGSMASDSRHVTGQQLCMGLRDYAIKRYGMMAPAVLRSWNLRRTDDFGRIVFAMIEHGLMSKTADDSLDDFRAVYDFEEAFAHDALIRHVGRS